MHPYPPMHLLCAGALSNTSGETQTLEARGVSVTPCYLLMLLGVRLAGVNEPTGSGESSATLTVQHTSPCRRAVRPRRLPSHAGHTTGVMGRATLCCREHGRCLAIVPGELDWE
jgi:hypothetical protein